MTDPPPGRPISPVGLVALGTCPGLPDDAFEHDGLVTKRPLRACALAELRPGPGQLLWDIGTGAGSIAIEWCRAGGPTARAVGFERVAERAARARANAERLTAPGQLRVIEGDVITDLAAFAARHPREDSPAAVFVGGGCSEGTITTALGALRPGGRFVAHAVTLDTEHVLVSSYRIHGGTLTRLAVETAEPLGSLLGWKPLRPVVQWSLTLPTDS
ncbi:MAG: precorrin-6Y C5,15-methyltransferase (decarboxylating) subunit CbiT [Dermatophilaceae bacterium]